MDEFWNQIRENNKIKEENLSKFACKSEEAISISENKGQDIRLAFSRDIDRIIHSKAYTRYIDKTQVYPFSTNDHITHRVLHVQLVSKVARTIGRALLLNEDLIEAIALGHDVGHTPFGHKGEDFLNNICKKNNIGLFRHNAQSVRLLNELENINLKLQTLDGILAHNGEILLNKYEPDKGKNIDKFLQELDNCYTIQNYSKQIKPMTIEGCVVRVSDIIAYIGRDIEDAIIVGSIKREEMPISITKVLGNTNAEIVNTLILDVVRNSLGKPYICFSAKVFESLMQLKEFNSKCIYNSTEATKNLDILEELFNKMFEIYSKKYQNWTMGTQDKSLFDFLASSNKEYLESTDRKRVIIDFMAGQTDKFFLKECELNIHGFNSIDLWN